MLRVAEVVGLAFLTGVLFYNALHNRRIQHNDTDIDTLTAASASEEDDEKSTTTTKSCRTIYPLC